MEEIVLIVRKIAREVAAQSKNEEESKTLRQFAKLEKVFDKVGFQHEVILASLSKFKSQYAKLEAKLWYAKTVKFVLYSIDNKPISGPVLHFSHFYRMAVKLDRKKKTDLKLQLTDALLALLDSEPDILQVTNGILNSCSDETLRASISLLSRQSKFVEHFALASKMLKRKIPPEEIFSTLEPLYV